MVKLLGIERREVQAKIDTISQGSLEDCLFVTDSDRTLTVAGIHGISYRVLRHHSLTPPGYVEETKRLIEEYHPYTDITKSPTKVYAERFAKVQEWWDMMPRVMSNHSLTKKEIDEIVRSDWLQVREAAADILNYVSLNGAVTCVYSAGFGPALMSMLEREGLIPNKSNLHLVSNFLSYDEQGNITGYTNESIHSLNKTGSHLQDTRHLDEVRNAIVIGDYLEDTQMVNDLSMGCVLTIGVLNIEKEEDRKKLPRYMDAFDLVHVHNESLDAVYDFITEIF